MPTNLLNINVPDAVNTNQEICHSFTANFILQRLFQNNGIHNIPYVKFTGDDLRQIIQMVGLQLVPIGQPIMAGDILIILAMDRHNPTYNHSMVAVDSINWFGVNNMGTFGLAFSVANINPAGLSNRRAINLQVLNQVGLDFIQANHILQRPNTDSDLFMLIYR